MVRRRFFAAFSLFLFICLAVPLYSDSQVPVGEPFAIQQGLTDAQTAQFSVVLQETEQVTYQILTAEGLELPVQRERRAKPFSEWVVDRLSVTGLVPGPWYDLIVKDDRGRIRDRRSFRALDLNQSSVRFALASCINNFYEGAGTWVQLSKDRPDLLFLIGDNVYADHLSLLQKREADPEQLWNRYVETRNEVAFFKFKRLIPTLATWDDHDYGKNDGDRTYPYREISMDILMSFFPQESRVSSSLTPGPGVASLFRAFGQNFFLLDGRTFRTESGAKESTHWGLDQEKWILEMAGRYPTPTWLFNGSQFFGAYHGKESVEGQHLESLQRLQKGLRRLPQVFVLGSGDVHFSEAMQIEKDWLGYPTLELTSSSIQGWYVRWMDRLLNNPRRIDSVATHNYILVDSSLTPNHGLKIKAVSRSADNADNFTVQTVIER